METKSDAVMKTDIYYNLLLEMQIATYSFTRNIFILF